MNYRTRTVDNLRFYTVGQARKSSTEPEQGSRNFNGRFYIGIMSVIFLFFEITIIYLWHGKAKDRARRYQLNSGQQKYANEFDC